jgi:hypothetical protein
VELAQRVDRPGWFAQVGAVNPAPDDERGDTDRGGRGANAAGGVDVGPGQARQDSF